MAEGADRARSCHARQRCRLNAEGTAFGAVPVCVPPQGRQVNCWDAHDLPPRPRGFKSCPTVQPHHHQRPWSAFPLDAMPFGSHAMREHGSSSLATMAGRMAVPLTLSSTLSGSPPISAYQSANLKGEHNVDTRIERHRCFASLSAATPKRLRYSRVF